MHLQKKKKQKNKKKTPNKQKTTTKQKTRNNQKNPKPTKNPNIKVATWCFVLHGVLFFATKRYASVGFHIILFLCCVL